MNKQAMRPSFFNSFPTLIKEEEAKKKGVTQDEQDLYALSQFDGWKILKSYIDDLVKDMDDGTALAMKQGLPFEEIGRNAVVIDLAKGIIKRIVNKVEDARDAVEHER